MNENYIVSKMATSYSGFHYNYIELTQKAIDFMNKYPKLTIKLYETSEMKQSVDITSGKPLSFVTGYKPHLVNQ